jgi:hypothetical protein
LPSGYGQACKGFDSGENILAHRASWIIHYGPISPGMLVCHRCDNPPCIRPEHLFLGTQRQNLLDMDRKGRNVINGIKISHKISDDDVSIIRRAWDGSWGSQTKLAVMFDVSKTTIATILHGRKDRAWRVV